MCFLFKNKVIIFIICIIFSIVLQMCIYNTLKVVHV